MYRGTRTALWIATHTSIDTMNLGVIQSGVSNGSGMSIAIKLVAVCRMSDSGLSLADNIDCSNIERRGEWLVVFYFFHLNVSTIISPSCMFYSCLWWLRVFFLCNTIGAIRTCLNRTGFFHANSVFGLKRSRTGSDGDYTPPGGGSDFVVYTRDTGLVFCYF